MPALFPEKTGLVPIGPRIRFAVDVPWEVFEMPGIRALLRAVALEAPPLVENVVVVTSTWREPDGNFSWHWRGMALDIRTGVDGSERPGSIVAPTRELRISAAQAWAMRIRLRAGAESDVIFGDAAHIDHIHVEHDGVKASTRFAGPAVA